MIDLCDLQDYDCSIEPEFDTDGNLLKFDSSVIICNREAPIDTEASFTNDYLPF